MNPIKNYTQEKLTINIFKANVYAILMAIPIMIIYGVPYYLLGHKIVANTLDGFTLIIGLLIGIIIHEFLHGITWAKYAKNGFRSIKFGIMWKKLTPYCHCKEPLLVKHYLWGAIMPAIILGFIPAIAAIIFGIYQLLAFAMVFTIAAGGDFIIIYLLRKEDKNSLVQDHPSEPGCFIYRKIEN